MEYTKPEVVRLASATAAIESMEKPHGNLDIDDPTNPFPSVTAYESDE
jgi:hypothetical protein